MSRTFTREFLIEVAKGKIPGHTYLNKFGKNSDVDTGTTPEDVWVGGGLYDFYPTSNVAMSAVSTDVDDVGTAVSSGTATGGSYTTLIDSGATFQTDGVAEGDVVLNDTNGEFGLVVTVDSEIQITHTQMVNGSTMCPMSNPNESGDTYRIGSNTSTGAGIIHVEGMNDYNVQTETIIMNGTTDVSLLNNYNRMYRAQVIIAGSSGGAEGTISVDDDAGTYNDAAIIVNGDNQTQQLIWTVPAGYTAFILKGYTDVTKASVAQNNFVRFTARARPQYGVFLIKGEVTIQNTGSSWWAYEYAIPPTAPEKTDVLIRIEEVSASDTGVSAGMDVLLINNNYL